MENVVVETLSKGESPVVAIWGERGMGKTTFAEKVFKHLQVEKSFQGFAWVTIHQAFQIKVLLQNILQQLLPGKTGHIKGKEVDIRNMNEIRLTQEILKFQENNRCLFVLEDVATAEDWRSISVALLVRDSSRILITTHSEEIAKMAASGADPYSIQDLTRDEWFNIFKEQAGFSDSELQSVGENISIYNLLGKGSPLLALVLGRSLKTDDATKRNELVNELKKYNGRSPEEQQVLELCYRALPDEVTPYLLYMGQFPEGQDIEIEKLHLLLAAEYPTTTSMESVQNALDKLAQRKFVEVNKDKASKKAMYKSFRLHNKIRNFCKSKGQDKGFFEIEEFKNAIYLRRCKGPGPNQNSNQVMALLISDKYESQQRPTWPSEKNDPKEFSGLTVLDFDGVAFAVQKLPKGFDKLESLRYLSFRGCRLRESHLRALPISVSKLNNLETLDLRVHAECKMTIPNNILPNSTTLRRLYFPKLYESEPNTKLQLGGLENLEVLVNFDTRACDVAGLTKLENLQILTAISDGNPRDLMAIIDYLVKAETKLQQSSLIIRNFDCYSGERDTMVKRLLKCKKLKSLHIEGQIGQLKKPDEISDDLTEIILDGSELKDDSMTVLGELNSLQCLELVNNAFIGDEILFPNKWKSLRSLKLVNLWFLQKLTFEKVEMPDLSTLVIDECGDLKEVQIPEKLHSRLQDAQRKEGDDVYSVEPSIKIIPDN